MATMTVSLPDPMKEWIERQVATGDYASASDYVRDLVRQDHARREREERRLTLDELRALIAESVASGPSDKTISDIKEEGRRIAKANGWLDEEN
jgi:antitoxin ParD1/3/4